MRCRAVRNTVMLAKRCAFLLLIACHTSSPSVSPGSASGETAPSSQPAEPARPPSSPPAPPPPSPAPPQETSPPPPQPPQQIEAPAQPPAQPVRPGKVPPTPSPSTNPGATGPGIGDDCGAGDTCAPGLTCIAYYGFAGARGPQFKSCEIRCTNDKSCPKGRTCMTVSDGPGTVCR